MRVKIINKIKNFFLLKLHTIKHFNQEIIFFIRDYGQIKPYSLTLEEVSNLKIINQINPRDSFIIGYASCHHTIERYKYNSISITENNKVFIKRKSVTLKHAFLTDLEDLLSRDDIYLENCKGHVLKELISYAYRCGKDAGAEEYQKLIHLNNDHNNIQNVSDKSKVVEINKYIKS